MAEHKPGTQLENAAAAWALRIADGLSRREKAELGEWLAADPSHATLLAEYQATWNRFERLTPAEAPLPAGPAPSRPIFAGWRLVWPALAAAAIALAVWWHPAPGPAAPVRPVAVATPPALPSSCERRVLDDGTVVELNRGATLSVAFTAAERRVSLVRGEATFAVAKNPLRPFIVEVDGVEVKAVGTAFNVRRGQHAVEVLVTEGVVHVTQPPAQAAAPVTPPVVLTAGQSVTVDDQPTAPTVATRSAEEIERMLAWRPRLLEFDDVPLAEIVAAFNDRNPVRLVIEDPALAAQRMTASFRSDNIEGFTRLLDGNYGIRAETREDGAITLRRR